MQFIINLNYYLLNIFKTKCFSQIGKKLDFWDELEFINFPKQYFTKFMHYFEINFIPVDPPGKLEDINHIKEIICCYNKLII